MGKEQKNLNERTNRSIINWLNINEETTDRYQNAIAYKNSNTTKVSANKNEIKVEDVTSII